MFTDDLVLPAILELVARFAPGGPAAVDPGRLGPPTTLAGDLGYDSVRLVELLLACGERFGVELPLEKILAGEALSVGAVAAHVGAARSGR